MDLNDIWQEHKTWILGVLAGVVVFLIASGVIRSRFDVSGLERQLSGISTQLKGQFYGGAEQRQASEQQAALDAELGKLAAQCYFRPRQSYRLAGKGAASTYYLTHTSSVKAEVTKRMEDAGVDFTQPQLGLPATSPVDSSDIERTLVGLDLVEDSLLRLLESSDAVQAQRPGAHGLRTLDKIQIDIGQRGAARPGAASGGAAKAGDALGERVQVLLRLRADSLTVERFLESLLAVGERRPLIADAVKIDGPPNPGEPVTLNLTLLALLENVQPETAEQARRG
jgi:hypothetical protein